MSDENSKAFTLPCGKYAYSSQQETRSLESLNTVYSWAIVSAVRRRFTGELLHIRSMFKSQSDQDKFLVQMQEI